MRAIEPTGRLRRLIVPALVTVVGVAILIGLGVWQLERRAWKHALMATLDERLSAAPVALPPAADWPSLQRAQAEFRRVTLTGTFLHDKEALVYALGSGSRGSPGGLGYRVFTPLRLADGTLVEVDRGFVPDDRKAPETRAEGQAAGPLTLAGILRWPETRPLFAPADETSKNLFFVRDPAVLAAAKGLGQGGAVAPFYVMQEAPQNPGGLPRVDRLQPNLPDNHLQYALTWFALAIALAGVFLTWAFGGRRLGGHSDRQA